MQQEATPDMLPLLGRANDRSVVHFSQPHQRSRDDNVKLRVLTEDLAATSLSQRREATADTTDALSTMYAAGHMQIISAARQNGGSCDSAHVAKRSGPFEAHVSPFLTAWTKAANSDSRQREMRSHEDSDALYHKVQQIPWEESIQWGFEFVSEDQRSVLDSDENIVEFDDEEAERQSNREANSTQSCAVPLPEQRSRLSDVRPRTDSAPFKSNSSAEKAPWRAEVEPFDMTKSRLYRWEIDNERGVNKQQPLRMQNEDNRGGKDANRGHAPAGLTCPLNKELESCSWIDAIGWQSTQEMPESKLVLDENDARLLFSVPQLEDDRATLRIPERKLGAPERRKQELEKLRGEKEDRLLKAREKLNIDDERADRVERGRVIASVDFAPHSLPAVKLMLTKSELPKSKLREFHRPRGKFKINERLHLTPPPVVPKKQANAMVAPISKSSDLNPVAGGKLILVEYTEQNPPMLSNPGMASRLLHYWRPPKQPVDSTRLGIKKGIQKATVNPPEVQMGQVITLGDRDETPFVGDIPPGRAVASLNSKLFKVPIFPHKPTIPMSTSPIGRESKSHELFLLCRPTSKGKNESGKTGAYLMELPQVFTAGQVEPQMQVPAPNSRSANEFIRPYMSFHILRLFKKSNDGARLKIDDITRAFPNQSGTAIRKRMKEVATFERGGNDSGWWKKKPASELRSEDDIRANISPESVCVYESMMAGHRRLLDIGLTKLFIPIEVNNAINLLLKRLENRKQNMSAKLVDPRGLDRRAKEKAQEKLWNADPLIRKLENDIQVARYIYEQLQLTPWNLTNNYVECHLQGNGSGMLQLSGIGDPSGRGEGFSFVRIPQSRASKKEEGFAANQNEDAALTGTSADLRKLKMKESQDVLRYLGVPDADIKQLKRWDRIHMIRDLSSRASVRGLAGRLKKFARGDRKSLSTQQQAYHRKCDEIYQRQMEVLSSSRTSFSSDEGESDDDEDMAEWGKDLEADILGGNEKIADTGLKGLFAKGGNGLTQSKEALAEREDAAELRRLVEEMKEDSGPTKVTRRSDVDAGKLRNQLHASGITEGNSARASTAASRGSSALSSALATPTDQLSRSSSPSQSPSGHAPRRKVLKRTTCVIEEDGSETVRIEFIIDDKQVARFQAMEQRKRKSEEHQQQRKRKCSTADTTSQFLPDNAKKRKHPHNTKKENEE